MQNQTPEPEPGQNLDEYNEPGTDRDFDTHAADVQNGYGYYDSEGNFHYYSNYWD